MVLPVVSPANSLFSLRRLLGSFSSSSSGFQTRAGPLGSSAGSGCESTAYLMSMFRRPPSVDPLMVPWNCCSFIGTVDRPVARFASSGPPRGAYTFLHVSSYHARDGSKSSSFKVLVAMWDELAEKALVHLKPNDFIYVHGFLGCYEKVDANGKRENCYKVCVREFNFVRHNKLIETSKKPGTSAGEEPRKSISDARDSEEYRDRLHLWQVFFANPYEWWDNRKGKRFLNSPDFKHKDTGECLWLKPDDPPWLTRKLQLYDSKAAAAHLQNFSGRSPVRQLDIEDLF